MLEKLFNSTTRAKLLKLFAHNPNSIFGFDGITKKLKLQAASAKKELENLIALGIIESFNEEAESADAAGNQAEISAKKGFGNKKDNIKTEKKYYRTNKNFILLNELKALIIKSQLLCEKDFVEKIKNLGRVKLLLLTGMFVNCNNSLIDIYIVGSINKGKFQELVAELEEDLGREVNYTVMNYNEFKYRRDMTDVFLYNVLEGKKLIIIDEINIFA